MKSLSPGNEPFPADHALPGKILDLLPACVAYVDADLRYVTANRTYAERLAAKKNRSSASWSPT